MARGNRQSRPTSSWPSTMLSDVRLAGDDVCWLEGRPREQGRNVIVRAGPDGAAADVTPADELDPAGPPPAAHEQAAAASRLALLNAAGHAQLAARAGATGRARGGHPVAVHLAGAADHLAAGRDLLQTHLTAAGTGAGSSPWAPVITSPPVTTALIAELARYAHRLAPWMSQPALARTPDPAVPAPACLALHTASGWLRAAGPVMVTAAPQHPPPAAGRRLPGAIPASTPPPRYRPGGTETIAGLCAGAASTALLPRVPWRRRWQVPSGKVITGWRRLGDQVMEQLFWRAAGPVAGGRAFVPGQVQRVQPSRSGRRCANSSPPSEPSPGYSSPSVFMTLFKQGA